MPRSPVDPKLIHRAEDLARDERGLSALGDALRELALPAARASLARDLRAGDPGRYLDDARALLAGAARDPGVARSSEAPSLRAGLARALGAQGVVPVDESEAVQLADDVGRAIARAWVQSIHNALGERGRCELDEALMPGASPDDEAPLDLVALAAEPYGLTATEARGVLMALRARYAKGAGPRMEVLGIELAVEPAGGGRVRVVASRGEGAESAGMVESGTRVRDGAVSPPDAAKGRKPGRG